MAWGRRHRRDSKQRTLERHQGSAARSIGGHLRYKPRSARRQVARHEAPSDVVEGANPFSENRSSPGVDATATHLLVSAYTNLSNNAPDSTSWTWSTCVNLNRNVGKPRQIHETLGRGPPRSLVKFPRGLGVGLLQE